ncbi:MAG: OmpA family protein [Muribaculaceae bacterium]|nr:OmpA family protein [Muribaculaceae bacterium]
MKKILLIAVLALGAITASAQGSVDGRKFSDNWSIGLKGGAVSPMKGYAFWPNSRGMFGLELRKQLTPVFGLGVEGEWSVNTSSWTPLKSVNTLDHQYVGVFGTVNLMNAFGGYKGTPRLFEIEAVAGTGWLHSYYHLTHFYYPTETNCDGNSWANKVGLNFNFNLGESRAWTIAIKPAILWNMNGAAKANNLGYSAQYNINHAVVEMEAGVTYHFKNSNGTHSFQIIEPMDYELVASLNQQINDLRDELSACGANNAALSAQIADLQRQLEECLKVKNAPCEKIVETLNNKYYVFFDFSSSRINAMQQAQIELIANTLKANKGSKVVVKGYASKDGNKAYNEKLSQKRADSIKNELVKRYGIEANRIEARGEGIAEIFDKLGWNRFADCEIVLAD